MNYTKENVLEALKTVLDPDLKKDLVSLGMIEDIGISGDTVSFKVVLTTPACPLKNVIRQDCINAVKKFLGDEVKVEPEMTARVTTRKAPGESKELIPGVKNIIAVVSGKGGVGKSTVAANLAVALAQSGAAVGLVDADIWGPSVPLLFGLTDARPDIKVKGDKQYMIPLQRHGVKVVSIGFLVEPEKALIWRGPLASGAMKQLFTDSDWGELDYLIVDTPPGTGDIHLTLLQSLHVSGVAVVTTPQKVALADALKAVNMLRSDGISVPVLGIIENMAYFTPEELPENKYYIFGRDGGKQLADELNIPLLGQIPIVQSICESGDSGEPVALDRKSTLGKSFAELAMHVSQQVAIWNAFSEMTDVKPCK
jgi:ATP-binding protein involved in chromosome partitioning